MNQSDIIIIIPARMASERLPGKPLADINGKPMIEHVWQQANNANAGNVFVACAEKEIADVVESFGGKAILTDPNHASGTDRIAEVLTKIDPEKKYNIVVNVQGDLPTLDPNIITDVLIPLQNPDVDISTLVAEINDEGEKHNPNVVKAVISFEEEPSIGRALYFTRASAPYGDGPLWHHIGIYAYRRDALDKFTKLPPSTLEKREKLEQLRALENDMVIGVAVSGTIPFGVDTPEDLEKARLLLI